jgi:hypothetical protein
MRDRAMYEEALQRTETFLATLGFVEGSEYNAWMRGLSLRPLI